MLNLSYLTKRQNAVQEKIDNREVLTTAEINIAYNIPFEHRSTLSMRAFARRQKMLSNT